MAVLVLAEHTNSALGSATAKAVTAARQLGGDVHILVAGSGASSAAAEAAKIDGVAKVLVADAPHLANGLAEEVAALVVPLMSGYDAFVAPATASGKNIAPRVAALLDVMQVSDITKVVAPDTFERPIYAGNATQTVKSGEAKKVITVRTASFAAAAQGGPAAVEAVTAPAAAGLSSFEKAELSKSDRPELTSARVIISGGRGIGFAANDLQVGQTGKVVAPELYIAVGISGAIQHLAGMKDSKVIVAINKDGEAPIFQVADYGLVGDLFQVLPELASELGKSGG